MALSTPSLPKVSLGRDHWVRLVVVGFFVVLAAVRVAPDLVRAVVPLETFDYATDGDGVVIGKTPAARGAKPDDHLIPGDRILVDRIPPFDRKGGIVGTGYTYDNPNRALHVLRRGSVREIHLRSRPEKIAGRALAIVRILVFLATLLLGAILFLVQPGIATAALFAYCACNDGPSTWLALQIPNPWRAAYDWYADESTGAAGPALALFALCLTSENDRVRRAFAALAVPWALVLGTLHAYGAWVATYAARLAAPIDRTYLRCADVTTWITIAVFAAALLRARADDRRRITWIVVAFALAAAARFASQTFYPGVLAPWENGVLITASALPILVVWVAVIRERFFNVDFVVGRAVVYVALSATVIGVISASEEIGTYVFYQNTDLAYGFLIAISMLVGATTGQLRHGIEYLVDRFIFHDRAARTHALELIAGYILDAETRDDVERALLEDVPHALDLAFGGIFERTDDGSFRLGRSVAWPTERIAQIARDDALLESVFRSRRPLRFSGRDSKAVKHAFKDENLTFAAPIFSDRRVSAIVIYGHSQIGLDLDPEERAALIEVVTHASIALDAIELARYRSEAPGEARPIGSR